MCDFLTSNLNGARLAAGVHGKELGADAQWQLLSVAVALVVLYQVLPVKAVQLLLPGIVPISVLTLLVQAGIKLASRKRAHAVLSQIIKLMQPGVQFPAITKRLQEHVELNGIRTDLHEDQESHATSIAAEGVHIFGNPADSAIGHYQTVLPHDLVSTLTLSVDFNGSLVD